MANEFYDHSGFPATNTRASSALMRAELDAIEVGFDKLPILAGNGGEIVTVKADTTGLESKTQVELHLVRDDGDVYTGTHDFTGATVSLSAATAATQLASDNSTKVATTAFVNSVAMNAALPAQSIGDAGKYIQTDGTNASWQAPSVVLDRLPIFSASTATATPATSMEEIFNVYPDTLLGLVVYSINFGAGLFVASSASLSGNVSTSPDGRIWTLRAMPSSTGWALGTDGTSFVAQTASTTTIARSTNGTTWTAGTALPGVAGGNVARPLVMGGITLVGAATASTFYRSTDYGNSAWSTQATPTAIANQYGTVGGLFWYFASGTTAYTSATGLTGSWTSRTLPITPTQTWQDYDGNLWIKANSLQAYKTTDGINWVAMGYGITSNDAFLQINGVDFRVSPTLGNTKTRVNGLTTIRSCAASIIFDGAYLGQCRNGNIHVFNNASANGAVCLIDVTAVDAKTALFTR